MAELPDFFARIDGLVDTQRLDEKVAVIVGVGSVGSEVARWLVKSSIGRLELVDGKVLEPHHISRHVNGANYLGWNKAEALADELKTQVPSARVEGTACLVDDSLPDRALDDLILAADVLVVSTDNRAVQRRVAARARDLRTIPAVLPGLYEDGGGEVFVQRRHTLPCFRCWDGFRPAGESLREVTALGVEGSTAERLTVELCLGILDRTSKYARNLARADGGEQQLFVLPTETRGYGISLPTIRRRPDCPVCGSQSTGIAAGQARNPAPAPLVSSPAMAVSPGLDFDSLLGRLVLLGACLALAFFSITLSHALISGLGIEHPSADHPSLIGSLLLLVLGLGGGFGCVGGIVGSIGAFFWFLAGLGREVRVR